MDSGEAEQTSTTDATDQSDVEPSDVEPSDVDRPRGQPDNESNFVDDPNLGRSMLVLDDRWRTIREVVIGAVFAGIGVVGLVMGVGDARGGDPAGDVYAVVSLIVLAYGLNVIRVNLLIRLRRPVRLLLGERGFDYPAAPGPMLWSEIESVGVDVPTRRGSRPRLKVRVASVAIFGRKHHLMGPAIKRLERQHGWLYPETGTKISDERLAELMGQRLTDFRQANPTAARTTRTGMRAKTSRRSG